MYIKILKFISILIFSSILTTGCKSSPSPQLELDVQANFFPSMLRIDGNLFALANQTPPNDLTIELFKSTLLKATLLRKYEVEAKNNFSLEKNRNPIELNSMCLMTKFLLNKSYIQKANLNPEFYEDIYGWITTKNSSWENLLKETKPGEFEYSCVISPSNIPN